MDYNASTTKLLDRVTEAGDGVWVNIGHLGERKSLHIDVGGGGTLKVCVSNRPEFPGEDQDEIQLGSDVTTTSMVDINYPYRWMKVKPVSVTDEVNAWLQGTSTRKNSNISS